MIEASEVEDTKRKYEVLGRELDERARRLWAASEAMSLGHGGIVAVSRATGIAESTIRIGQKEIEKSGKIASEKETRRVRRAGGGRKQLTEKDSALFCALDALVEPTARGDPMSPLRWSCKSTRRLAKELTRQGHAVSHSKVAQLLDMAGYSLQGTFKTREGASNPDRNAQFEHVNKQVKAFQARGQPVVSVDTKKKELVGDFANKGFEYQPKGNPEEVRTHDFIDKKIRQGYPLWHL